MTYEEFKIQYSIRLNRQQEEAVRQTDGPVLLLAVPGSGKTTVLVTRLGYMLHCKGIPPERILTVTYTVAATRDMKARFICLLHSDSSKKQIRSRTTGSASDNNRTIFSKKIGHLPRKNAPAISYKSGKIALR